MHELNECVSSRVLKLEKENRELQASLERLKEDNHLLQEQQLSTQELERENQSVSKKVGRLIFTTALHTLWLTDPRGKCLLSFLFAIVRHRRISLSDWPLTP